MPDFGREMRLWKMGCYMVRAGNASFHFKGMFALSNAKFSTSKFIYVQNLVYSFP